MDSITHLALGACLGEVFADRKLGKKAMIWGALAQSAADIDFVAAFWMDTTSNLLAHRGFTHSFLFCLLISFFLALIAERWHRPHNISLKNWFIFFGGVIFSHVLLDGLNNYGVGWFEPFSKHRFSLNLLYVADPLFSIWTVLVCIILLVTRTRFKQRRRLCIMALTMTGVYMLYCALNKIKIERDVRKALQREQVAYKRVLTTPAPFQNWLWYVLAETDSGYMVGFRSVYDKERKIPFTWFPRQDHLLDSMHERKDVQQLLRFSQHWYTMEQWNDTLVFNDLRFGQVAGWEDPRKKFAFHYFLKDSADNTLVVQRGRFQGWNRETFSVFWKRIQGN